MAIDLSGGLPIDREYLCADLPGEPEFRDAVNVWIEEENGRFGMRIGVEMNSSRWESPETYLDIAFADGRVMSRRSDEAAHPRIGADGRATVIGGGPLRFELVKPFEQWKVFFDGEAAEITTEELIETPYPEEKVIRPVSFEIVMNMAAPPWEAGAMLSDEENAAFRADSAGFVSPRYEQLCRCEGRIVIDGETIEFRGQGLRIRRQGLRKFADFPGHVWQSCLFPSGKAFGLNTFGTHADAKASYAEAFYYDGEGGLTRATILEVPWMRELLTDGDSVPIRLETKDGEVRVEGISFVNCRSRYPALLPSDFAKDYPIIQQSHALYKLGDERAAGMMERSTPPDKLATPAGFRVRADIDRRGVHGKAI